MGCGVDADAVGECGVDEMHVMADCLGGQVRSELCEGKELAQAEEVRPHHVIYTFMNIGNYTSRMFGTSSMSCDFHVSMYTRVGLSSGQVRSELCAPPPPSQLVNFEPTLQQ